MAQDNEFVKRLLENPGAAGKILAEVEERLDAMDRTPVIARWVWSLRAKYPTAKTPGEALRREGVDPAAIRALLPPA